MAKKKKIIIASILGTATATDAKEVVTKELLA